jgi:hypothetical protein
MSGVDAERALRERFAAGTLAASEFDHVAHVRVARAYLRDFGLSAGARGFIAGLKDFTARNGVPEKYHDTLTHALLHLIYADMAGGPADESFDAFRARCPHLFARARALVERHYSSEVLDSPAARAAFVEPDRAPLPWQRGEPPR